MIPYKDLPLDKSQYIKQIILHQNRLRAKLPFILDYSPDKHFQSLASSAGSQKQKHLHSSISKHNLTNLGPFSSPQLQVQFNPMGYLQLALNALNTGQYRIFDQEKPIQRSNQLLYRGYIRLITTEKPSYSGGSQVNMTLYNRATLDKQLSNNYSKKNRIWTKQLTNRQYNSCNNIIGMLLYLQCLKISELQITRKQKQLKSTHMQFRDQSHQQMQQYEHRDRNNRKRFSQLYTTIQQQYPYQNNILMNNNGNSRVNRNSGSLAREYYGISQYGNIYRNRSIYAKINKNIIMQTNTTKYTAGNINNPQDIAYNANNIHMANTPNTNNHYNNNNSNCNSNSNSGSGGGLRLQYLPRFSSESNIWKNVGQRNWNYKQLFNNRHQQYSGNSTDAFVYMDTNTPRTFYLTPNHKYDNANTNADTNTNANANTNGKMLANTFNTDRSYYYLS